MGDVFKGGLDLKFVDGAAFESVENVTPADQHPIIARNALRLLMMGWPSESWTELLSWPVLKAVLVQRDPELLKEFRLAFQQGFELLFTQLQGQKLTPEQSEQVQLYLSNCLCLLPYSDLTPYESIKIPQNINDEWVLVEYHVTPIELTPTKGFKSLFIHDKDRVFAYGLEPINHQGARSHLIFMGTTYPAGQGFVSQINTDLKGFQTVGESLYLSGRARVIKWLLNQKDKVNVCGVSLGGSLSLLLAIDQGMHLNRVDALNPAGLYESWYKNKFDRWDKLEVKPQVVVQEQGNDPVSLLGVWKKSWQILKVKPPEDKRGPNPFCDHFLNYAGFSQTEFTYADPVEENSQRKGRNFLFYVLLRSIIYYSSIAPYNYFFRPLAYFSLQNWIPITLSIFSLIGISVLLHLMTPLILPLSFLTATLTVAAFDSCIYLLKRLLGRSEDNMNCNFAQMHDPSLPRNPSLDIYNNDNKITVELTYEEINTYYTVMRCLVKQKNFLPEDNQDKNPENGLSKKELLLASMKPENKDVVVNVTKTKAKAVLIKDVLTFVNQLGIENENELKQAVEQDYRHYSMGKHH